MAGISNDDDWTDFFTFPIIYIVDGNADIGVVRVSSSALI